MAATQSPEVAAAASPANNGDALKTESPAALNPAEANSTAATQENIELDLPTSAKDGLIKKPFPRPLDTAKPQAPAELNSDQQSRYDAVLRTVSSWTEIPTKAEKNSPATPITDNERMWLTRECLLRYLRATKWNVSEAETRLKTTLTWRREYGMEKLTPDYISIENETGKQVILGYDIHGRPCLYLLPSKQNTEKSDRQVEHLVFMIERVIDLMGPDQETMALLVNFNDTKSGQNASLGQAKETLNILQNHYPERLGRALVSNGK